jgi:hypothetical protein
VQIFAGHECPRKGTRRPWLSAVGIEMDDWVRWAIGLSLPLLIGLGAWMIKMREQLSVLTRTVEDGFTAQRAVNDRVARKQDDMDMVIRDISLTLPTIVERLDNVREDLREIKQK